MFDLELLRADLREELGVDADDLDDPATDRLINRSYQWLLNAFKFRAKEVTVTFNTVAGVRLYDLPANFESLRGVSIADINIEQHTSLDRMTIDVYEKSYNESETKQSFSTHYVREGNCIKLWPTPDDVYKITLKYDRLVDELSSSNIVPEIPKNWFEFILDGAVYRGHKRFGDFQRAAAEKQQLHDDVAAAKIVEKKEEGDSHRSGLEVILPEYRV